MAYEDEEEYDDSEGRRPVANLLAPRGYAARTPFSASDAVALGSAALAQERARLGRERLTGSANQNEDGALRYINGTMVTPGFKSSATPEANWRDFFGPKQAPQAFDPWASRATNALMASRGLRPGGQPSVDREEWDTSSYKPSYMRATRDPVTGGTMIVDLRSKSPFANPKVLPNTTAPKNPMDIPGRARPQGTARSVGQLTEDDGREVKMAGADGKNVLLDYLPGGKYSSYDENGRLRAKSKRYY